MKKKILLTVCIVGILVGIGYWLYSKNKALGAAIIPKPFTDLIGTRVASSTTGVGWYGAYGTASTTYPFPVAGADKVSIVFDIVNASTTPGGSLPGLRFSLLGSNDVQCSTASTTTKYNQMTTDQIRWFDASNYLNNSTVITGLSNATTTYQWNSVEKGLAKVVHLVDLDVECLAVQINASSTVLHGSYKLKD